MRSNTPSAPRFVSHVKSVSTGLAAAMAKMRTTPSARMDCVNEAAHGEPVRRLTRPKNEGSTPSRPRAKA